MAQRPHGNNDLLHQAPMMKGTIRKGSSRDAAAILAVMEDVYEASPWKLEQIEADLEQESIFYFLAVDEEQVLGFVAIQETLYEAAVSYTHLEDHKDMVDQEIHQLLSAHQGVNSQPTVQQETKDASKESQSEHLPNTASLEASFAAEAVLLAALGGFLLAGKKKEE